MAKSIEELTALKTNQEDALKDATEKKAPKPELTKLKTALTRTVNAIKKLEAPESEETSETSTPPIVTNNVDKSTDGNPKLCGKCTRKYGTAFCNSCVVLAQINKEKKD
jgi:hypothetical protein